MLFPLQKILQCLGVTYVHSHFYKVFTDSKTKTSKLQNMLIFSPFPCFAAVKPWCPHSLRPTLPFLYTHAPF